MKRNQFTINEPVSIEGIGLYSGKISKIELLPAPEDTGIVFIKDKAKIKASVANAYSYSSWVSLLSNKKFKVSFVEHLLAAIWMLRIDNLYIRLSSSEIPILDGSALPFLELLKEAGKKRQNKIKKFFTLTKEFKIKEKNSALYILPNNSEDKLIIEYQLSYLRGGSKTSRGKTSHRKKLEIKGPQSLKLFEEEIAPSRTFSFISQIKKDLQGGNLDNALILDDNLSEVANQMVNKYNQRFEDEPIRHKILDLIGDLALLPLFSSLHIIAKNTYHKLHILLLKEIYYTYFRRT